MAEAAPSARAATPASPAAVWGALAVVYVVWGSTYLAIRVIVETVPPLVAMGARFLVAGALLALLVTARRGARALRTGPRQLAAAGLVGLLLLLGGNGMVAIAERTVPSGLAALLVAATPLWLVCLRTLTGDRPRAVSLTGTLLGFAGLAVLARPGSAGAGVQTWGVLLVLGASASWAVGSFVSGRLPLPADPFVTSVYEMLLGGAAMALVGVLRGELRGLHLDAVPAEAWFSWVYLVVAGSLAAFSAYVWLLGNAPISLVATYAYVNPVVAVLLGALLLAEAVTPAILVGGAVVVLGVGLVVTVERPRSAPGAPGEPPAPTSLSSGSAEAEPVR